jgi:hypothetical protein
MLWPWLALNSKQLIDKKSRVINFNFIGANFVSSRLGHSDVASDQQSSEGRSAKHLRRRRVVDEVAPQSGISSEVDVHALHR